MVLAELFTNWPPAIRVFLNHQMGCVGCSMAPFDTIAEAAANYGVSLPDLLAEIKSSVAANHQTEIL